MRSRISVLFVGGRPRSRDAAERAFERALESVTATSVSTPDAAVERLDRPEGTELIADERGSAFRTSIPPVDCVVAEHDPPPVDGLALLERVRNRYPSLPFVLFPREGSEALASEAISRGVTDYVSATEDRYDRLATRVESVVSSWRAERSERERDRFQSELLEDLFEQLPAHLYVKDADARYLYVSEYYLDEGEEPWGKTDLEEYPEEFARSTYEDDLRVIEEGERIINKEEWAGFANAWNITSKVPWRGDDGEIRGQIGITRQITELKAYEEALERQNERLERFASVVSHDLRNPLTVATGNLELLREESDSEFIEPAIESLERMDRIIDDVLTMARSGQKLDDSEVVSLRSLVHRAWENADTADAELVVEDDRTFDADRLRLQRAIENLFRNSIEHGGDDVTVRVGALEANGFYVEDDGPGIPDEIQDNVFDPGFSTGDAGIGLGLNIVMEIVQAHGWRISVTDGEFGGARFEITDIGGPRF